MNSRVSNSLRQLMKLNSLRSVSAANSRPFTATRTSNSNKNLRVWRPFDDTFFNMASRLMRNLEREFDWVNRQTANSRFFPAMLERQTENLVNDMIVTDKDGNRKFQLVLDLGDFQPEEIKVKTEGHTLSVSAKKQKQVSVINKPV